MSEIANQDAGPFSVEQLSAARRALAEAETLPEITRLIDQAEIVRQIARRSGVSLDAINAWAEFKLDGERAGGLMLKVNPPPQGRPKNCDTQEQFDSDTVSSPPRLDDLGITRGQSSRWQMLAELADEEFEDYKSKARAAKKEITQAGALKLAKHKRREQAKKQRAATFAEVVPERPEITLASWAEWLPAQPICDLLITDPPYSTDIDDVFVFAADWLPAALEKVKPSGRAYVCIGAYPGELLAYLMVKPPEHLTLAGVLVWTYRNTLGPKPSHDYKLNWQAILYYRGAEAPALDCPEMVEQFSVQDINAPDGRRGDRWHAWQKPDQLADRLIRHSTRPGAAIVDPFAGTGTFLLAAAKLGRRAAGCEIDPENLAIAEERGCVRAS